MSGIHLLADLLLNQYIVSFGSLGLAKCKTFPPVTYLRILQLDIKYSSITLALTEKIQVPDLVDMALLYSEPRMV
jgi:hypothetical protein